MVDVSKIAEHMDVVGSDDLHVGTVDHVDDKGIKLTRKDPAAEGRHHHIPTDWIASVDSVVRLNKSSEDAKQHWHTDADAPASA